MQYSVLYAATYLLIVAVVYLRVSQNMLHRYYSTCAHSYPVCGNADCSESGATHRSRCVRHRDVRILHRVRTELERRSGDETSVLRLPL